MQIIELPKIKDHRGNLSFVESERHIPFQVQRVFWIYDVAGGEVRGGHAYREGHEFIIALSGSFDVVLHDGTHEHRFHLNRSYYGLYVPPMTWRQMENFSTNSVALVLASNRYDPNDYIEDFNLFQQQKECCLPPPIQRKIELPIPPHSKNVRIDAYAKQDLRKVSEDLGSITVIEGCRQLPFEVIRTFHIYDVPGGTTRGGHAHRELYEYIVATSGSFEVRLFDGTTERTFLLNRPYEGLLIEPGVWINLENFSSGAGCLVLTSDYFNQQDNLTDYEEFLQLKTHER